MKWVTTRSIHFDRLVCPWLLLRFVDPDAEFTFIPPGSPPETSGDVAVFGMPGAELSLQGPDRPTFSAIRQKYGLDDPVLDEIEAVVVAGVRFLLKGEQPDPAGRAGQLVHGMLAIAEGLMMTSHDDSQIVERSLPLFDAIYATLLSERLLAERKESEPPAGVSKAGWHTAFVTALTHHVREKGTPVMPGRGLALGEAFETALSGVREKMIAFLARR